MLTTVENQRDVKRNDDFGKISGSRTTRQNRVRSQYMKAQVKNNATHGVSKHRGKERWSGDQYPFEFEGWREITVIVETETWT